MLFNRDPYNLLWSPHKGVVFHPRKKTPQQPRGQPLLLNNKPLPRLSFTPENPTGNYFLDLANPADFAVAEQVLVLNQWEILQLVKGKTEKRNILNEIILLFDSWMCFP